MEHNQGLILFRAHGNTFYKKNRSSKCSQLPGESQFSIRAASEGLNHFVPIPINLNTRVI